MSEVLDSHISPVIAAHFACGRMLYGDDTEQKQYDAEALLSIYKSAATDEDRRSLCEHYKNLQDCMLSHAKVASAFEYLLQNDSRDE